MKQQLKLSIGVLSLSPLSEAGLHTHLLITLNAGLTSVSLGQKHSRSIAVPPPPFGQAVLGKLLPPAMAGHCCPPQLAGRHRMPHSSAQLAA
jgi:hypothetical protein